MADAAQRQGATTITTLASAGSSGKHSGNILRSLASNFCGPAGSPSIQWDKMASVNDEIDHPFILLHLFFDTAWTAGLLKRAFFSDYDTCADFWNSAEDRQHLRQHLCHRGHSAGTPSEMVLVVLHGDGGQFSHQNSLYVVCWNGLFGLGTTIRRSASSSR